MTSACSRLHQLAASLPRHRFPFDEDSVPENGIYLLLQSGERGHSGDRIVRVGTHRGNGQLRSRLKQHFVNPKKDRNIFRKNIGRALLAREDDPFIEQWEVDLTSRKARAQYAHRIDLSYQDRIETRVTEFVQEHFSFVAIPVPDQSQRLAIESKLVSTLSWCESCQPSTQWLGRWSPKAKIAASGLWQVNEFFKESLTQNNLVNLTRLMDG